MFLKKTIVGSPPPIEEVCQAMIFTCAGGDQVDSVYRAIHMGQGIEGLRHHLRGQSDNRQ
jgi:hypothetical protein